MSDIQVLYDDDGVVIFAHLIENDRLDIEYDDHKCPFADTYEHHTTLTANATQKLCEIYQCDIEHLLEKVKEHFGEGADVPDMQKIETDGQSIDEILELYKELTVEGRFQKFCDENHLEYSAFTWTGDDEKENKTEQASEDTANSEVINPQFEEFIEAIANKNKTKVRKMLKNGFDVNAASENGRTGLMMAVQTDDLSMVKLLVEAGADIEQATKENETAFLYACRVSENIKIIKYLIEQGANTQARNVFGHGALFITAEYNHSWKVVEYLLGTKLYDINDQECNYNYSPLMAAARFNTIDVVNVLIDHGANLYAKDADGWVPVLHAAAHCEDNPMNLIRLIGLDPSLFFFHAGKENLRKVSEDNHNLNIRMALDGLLSIYLFCSKTPLKDIPN